MCSSVPDALLIVYQQSINGLTGGGIRYTVYTETRQRIANSFGHIVSSGFHCDTT